ncbi:exodeoxyribonuclease VII large subunit [Gemmobacter nectariphilus]|uniref:exodeoxyribonuclease VII large subunit n=1 Tax=Gemmobacter nectariphilus TaxID=220343 RepID=UPI00040F9BBD|nr:exodeoxyribonuclease VII large subunit [Gemmobacter nectariphilus]
MSDLFEDPAPGGNSPEFSVSEISGAVKRVLEGEFGRVRVRGEIGRVSRPSSGHLYFDLKDSNAVLAAVSWKGQVARMQIRPEEGMEVVATGRLTTFPGQSKYQLIVEDVAPAGLGALMVMLEKRKAALAAEGLFDASRKRPIPYLPRVIGVVTSPSGAVIRDILHRLRDRFPRHVLIWPVAVQGEKCAPEVAAAIRGFNAIAPGGPVPRPDLIIVARGGGSLEDLWGFNEEIVVRAAADSRIPLISAVGHETDTTLIDHAADRRAPTPTAAAEMAVPVRIELLAALETSGARLSRALAHGFTLRRQRATDLSRALPRPDSLTGPARQRLDLWADRLPRALGLGVTRRRARLAELAATVRPTALARLTAEGRARLADRTVRLDAAPGRRLAEAQTRLTQTAARLAPALARTLADHQRLTLQNRAKLADLAARLDAAPQARIAALRERLDSRDRLRQTLGHMETLRRGYAVVRGDGHVVTSKAAAETASALELEFHDGRLTLGGKPARKSKDKPPEQGSLF